MFIDRYIHPDLLAGSDQAFRARVLAVMIAVYILIIGATAIYVAWFAPVPQSSIEISEVLLLSLLGVYGAVFYVLRRWGAYGVCCHLMVGFAALTIFGGTIVSGGPVASPATILNVVPIILAFVLLGQRAGLLWAQWVVLGHIVLIVLGLHVIPYPMLLDTRYMVVHHAFHWVVAYGAIIALMVVFGRINVLLTMERDQERARLTHLASHDSLTDLPNRSGFDEQLAKSIARADRQRTQVALLVLDLDGFKPINDALGHAAGDLVLRVVSDRLRNNVRANDTVARLGGDEFAIILEGLKDAATVHNIGLKINKVLSEAIATIPNELAISASIGIAFYPLHTGDKNQLLKLADAAMYDAKKEKNRCCLYNSSMAMDASKSA